MRPRSHPARRTLKIPRSRQLTRTSSHCGCPHDANPGAFGVTRHDSCLNATRSEPPKPHPIRHGWSRHPARKRSAGPNSDSKIWPGMPLAGQGPAIDPASGTLPGPAVADAPASGIRPRRPPQRASCAGCQQAAAEAAFRRAAGSGAVPLCPGSRHWRLNSSGARSSCRSGSSPRLKPGSTGPWPTPCPDSVISVGGIEVSVGDDWVPHLVLEDAAPVAARRSDAALAARGSTSTSTPLAFLTGEVRAQSLRIVGARVAIVRDKGWPLRPCARQRRGAAHQQPCGCFCSA